MNYEPISDAFIAEQYHLAELATNSNTPDDIARVRAANKRILQTSSAFTEGTAVPLSSISTQPLTWLWPQRIPLGKLTLLDGEPGGGTSLLALSIAASVSSNEHSLPGDTPSPHGNVLIISPHDQASDTIQPRLAAAGGDLSRIFLLNTVKTVDPDTIHIYDRTISLADDLDPLERAIKKQNALLLIIDPLHSVLGPSGTRIYSRPSSRPSPRTTLIALAQLAHRTNCAILLIRRVKTRPSDLRRPRPSGSLDLVSAARSALLLLADPNDEQTHLLIPTKHPLSLLPPILAYQVLTNESGVPTIQWLPDWQHIASDQSPSSATYSAQRQAIYDCLRQSPSALSPREIAICTGCNYEGVRKMLQRLCQEGELVTPARGLYTLPGHPCELRFLNNLEPLTPESLVPSAATDPDSESTFRPIPYISTGDSGPLENLFPPSTVFQPSAHTHVSNVPTIPEQEQAHNPLQPVANNPVREQVNSDRPSQRNVSNVSIHDSSFAALSEKDSPAQSIAEPPVSSMYGEMQYAKGNGQPR